MKLAMSNIGFTAADDETLYDLLPQYGFTGLEIAPSRFVGDAPYTRLAQAAHKAQILRERHGLAIPSMQSIWYGQTGNLFEEQDARRLEAYTEQAVAFAEAVQCSSLVFGCPKSRVIPQGKRQEDAIAFFARISDAAVRHGAVIALEANPPLYGTNFCNTSEEAFRFAAQVPGLRVNYDLGTLLANGETLEPLAQHLGQVSHIHLSEPGLVPIARRGIHRELAQLLREQAYSGWVSVEMSAQPPAVIEDILAYVAEVFTC